MPLLAGPARLILCLVTDRRRLTVDADARSLDLVMAQVADAARAGIDLVQVREPDLSTRALTELVRGAVRVTRGSGTRVVVSDRPDVAMAAGADGVHLRGRSIDALRVRHMVPPAFLLGRSVHRAAEAAAAEAGGGLDYLIVGTVFPSQSKPGGTALGVTGLASAVQAVCLPVLAIGGVTLSNLATVARAGAAGIAAIGLFMGDPKRGGEGLAEVVESARRLFDTAGLIP